MTTSIGAVVRDRRGLIPLPSALVLPGRADLVHDRVVGDLLFVEEREDWLLPGHPGGGVGGGAGGGAGRGGARRDPLEDRAVIRAAHALVEEAREVVELVAGERRVLGQEDVEVGVE